MDRAAGPDVRLESHQQPRPRPRLRPGVPPWLTATFAAVFLIVAAVAPVATAATATSMAPACESVNVRTSASTSASIKVRLGTSAMVTVVGTVSGGKWGTYCPTWKSGSSWYRVTHVNGKSVSTLYGVTYLYAATGVLKAAATTTIAAPTTTIAPTTAPTSPAATPAPTPTPTAAPTATPATPAPTPSTTTMIPACNGVNLRTSTSTSATLKVRLYYGATVGVVGTVRGSAWSTVCGTSKSGSGWYKVSQVNGKSVSSLYGVAYLYAATGVLKAAAVTTIAAPTTAPTAAPTATATSAPTAAATAAPTPASTAAPTPTPPPTPAPTAAATPTPAPSVTTMAPACDGVNVRTSTSTSATIKARLSYGTTVGVVATVSGSSWSTVCPTSKSGSGWYRISEVNGAPVSSLYGVSYLYAATGVLGTPPAITPLPASVTFYGRGWGHGVGLSQWGAKGRATAGQDAATILAHYYQGTTIQPLSGAPTVRVLVLNDYYPSATAPLTAYGRGGEWSVGGIAGTFPKDARLRVVPVTQDGTMALHLIVDLPATGEVLHDAVAPTDFRLEPAAGAAATLFELTSKPGTDDLYRGSLRFLFQNGTADVIDSLPLEQYLRGVVPVEMPSSWPLEARKAQAIAARSYAMYRVNPSSGTFDVYDDTRSQVYDGVRGETAAGDAAVSATNGVVLRYGTSIANAMFHSTGGGATENNEFAFNSSTGALTAGVVPYLRGSSDRDANGVAYDAGATYATWKTDAYSIATLSSIFAKDSRTNVGTLTGLGLANRGVSGRLISVTLVGTGGSKTVSGNVFTSVFNTYRPSGSLSMRSTLVSLAPIP